MKKLFTILMMVCLGVFVIGCGPKADKPATGETPAAGSGDAGTEDAGTEDAGTEDTGTEDAGTEAPAP